eukprot:2012698-Lingulodinium_polyedra.AAC.1
MLTPFARRNPKPPPEKIRQHFPLRNGSNLAVWGLPAVWGLLAVGFTDWGLLLLPRVGVQTGLSHVPSNPTAT